MILNMLINVPHEYNLLCWSCVGNSHVCILHGWCSSILLHLEFCASVSFTTITVTHNNKQTILIETWYVPTMHACGHHSANSTTTITLASLIWTCAISYPKLLQWSILQWVVALVIGNSHAFCAGTIGAHFHYTVYKSNIYFYTGIYIRCKRCV